MRMGRTDFSATHWSPIWAGISSVRRPLPPYVLDLCGVFRTAHATYVTLGILFLVITRWQHYRMQAVVISRVSLVVGRGPLAFLSDACVFRQHMQRIQHRERPSTDVTRR